MNLTTIHHTDYVQGQNHNRESVYHVRDKALQVRIKVHKDKSYAKQCWARLDLWNGTDFITLFTADQNKVHILEPWETEDDLLYSFGRFIEVPFAHFDTEAALVESGDLEGPAS